MAIEGLGSAASYNPYAGAYSSQQVSARPQISETANNATTSVISDTSGVLTDKMMQLALLHEMVSEAEGTNDKSGNLFLEMLLQNILFGNEGATTISPTEQAQMLNDIISSGQPGSIAQAMGNYTGGGAQGATYSGGGAMSMGGAIGGLISVAA